MKVVFTFVFFIFSINLYFAQTLEWAQSLGNNLNNQSRTSVVSDHDGNVYTIGFFNGIIDFDPGLSTFNLASIEHSIFVQKLDSNGDFIWAYSYNEGERGSEAYSATIDSQGNVIFVGSEINNTIGNAAVFYNIIIYKIDPTGNIIFRNETSGGNGASNRAWTVDTDSQDNIFVGGYFATPTEFGTTSNNFNLISNGSFDIFFCKLNPNGNYLWVKNIGGPGADICWDINIDDSDNVYIGGNFTETVDFNPETNTNTITSNGESDGYICKFSNDGNLIWNTSYGSPEYDNVQAIDIDNNGNAIIAGAFSGTIDFDSSSNSFNMTPSGDQTATYVTKLDSNGSFVWAKSFGGNTQVIPDDIVIDDSNNFYIVGVFENTVDFDPSDSEAIFSSNGSLDFFIQKYCEETLLWTETFGGTDIDTCHSIDLDIFGNILLGGTYHNVIDFDPSDSNTAFFTSAGYNDIYTIKLSQGDFETPIAYNIDPLLGCDENNDGFSEYFETSLIENQVIGNQSEACFNILVSYYDEQGNELPSPLPNPFTNTTPNSQDITVRVSNALNSNYFSETTLTLQTTSGPSINSPLNLFACDEGNGIGVFDTSLIENQLIGNQTDLLISYYDENGNSFPSPLPLMLENTTPLLQTIYVKVEEISNPLCYTTTSFDLIISNTPEINLNPEYFICEFEPSLNLSVDSDYDFIEWLNEEGIVISTTSSVELTNEGVYSINISLTENDNECTDSYIFQLERTSPPEILNVNFGGFGENYIEIITTENGNYEYSINGTDFQNSNYFTNLQPGIYNVYVRDKGNCGEDYSEIIIMDYPKFFTPNGDSFNDFWEIKNISNYPMSKIYIYDRYGKLLKQINPSSKGWDGTFNGKLMSTNDYWFIVEFMDKRTFSGHFTLKR